MSRAITICLWTAAALSGGWAAGAPATRDTAALIEQLTSGAPEAQRAASNELAAAGAAAVAPLVKALHHKEERVRFHAAWALRRIGKPAAEALGAVLAGSHAAAKHPAAYALAGVPEPSLLPSWLAAAEDSDFRVRYYAVRALGALEDPRVDDAVQRALQDEAALVRQAAAGVAARRGNPGGIAGLAALMHPGVDADSRFQAAFALWKLKDKRAVPALIGGLDDADPRVRHHCAWALGDLEAAAAAESLVDVLVRSSDNTLKSYATVSLKQITGQHFGFDTTRWREWLQRRKADGHGGE